MSDTRDIILSHPIHGKPVGARITLDADRARQIVQAGGAQYAPEAETPAEAPVVTVSVPPGPPVASVRGDKAATATTGTVTPPE